MIYEVLTTEGRSVEVPHDVWLQFPADFRRQLAEPSLEGLWPGRIIELFGARYRVKSFDYQHVHLVPLH